MVINSWENGQYKEIWVYSKETEADERALNYTGVDGETMNFIINGELDPFPLSYGHSLDGHGSPCF